MADLLLRQPIVDSGLVQRELEVPAMTANHAINALGDAGVLTKVSGNYRDRKWSAREVLSALDDFARRSGRAGLTGIRISDHGQADGRVARDAAV